MTLEQQVIHYKNLVKLYRFDYLTGLKQRQDFENETRAKMVNQKFYLTMFDVTGLHAVNRDKGYAAGDALIKQVANSIQHCNNVWEMYRIGGDEFIVITFEDPEEDCVRNATGATVYSGDYTSLSKMVEVVDSLVTAKKIQLKRRRED